MKSASHTTYDHYGWYLNQMSLQNLAIQLGIKQGQGTGQDPAWSHDAGQQGQLCCLQSQKRDRPNDMRCFPVHVVMAQSAASKCTVFSACCAVWVGQCRGVHHEPRLGQQLSTKTAEAFKASL